jgi:hypothetical protein
MIRLKLMDSNEHYHHKCNNIHMTLLQQKPSHGVMYEPKPLYYNKHKVFTTYNCWMRLHYKALRAPPFSP